MSIHYKFRSSLDYDTLKIDGQNISLSDLRDAIMAQKKIRKTSNDTLEITNAQTKEVYVDDRTLIPKNSSVIVKRVPATTHGSVASYAPLSDKDVRSTGISFAKLSKTGDLANANASEEDKIKAMMTQAGEEWSLPTYGRRMTPSGSYTCFKCGQAGHFIRNCPSVTTTDAKYIQRTVRRNYAGIPKEHVIQMMKEEEKKRTAILEQAGQTIGAYRPVVGSDVIDHDQVPAELQCPLCKKLFVDAVLIPCCGASFCDDCIRCYLMEKEFICPSCQTHTSPDQLVANVQLRKAAEKYRNQLEGINKGVTTVRTTADDSKQTTDSLKSAKVEPSGVETPQVAETVGASSGDTVLPTSKEEDEPNTAKQSKAGPPIEEEKKELSEATLSTSASLSVSTAVPIVKVEKVEEEVERGKQSVKGFSAAQASLLLNSVSSQSYLPHSLQYASTSLAPGIMTSSALYNNYIHSSVLKPRLPASIPAPVLNQSTVASLPGLPRSSSFPTLRRLHPRMEADQLGMGGIGLRMHGVGSLFVPRAPLIDPMRALDKQRPLSEEEFYREQKKLMNIRRHRHDSGDSRSRYYNDRRQFNEGKKRHEHSRARRGRERSRERSMDRSRDRSRGRGRDKSGDQSPTERKRKRSTDSSRRAVRNERKQRSTAKTNPARKKGKASPRSVSGSRSRSRSFSRSISRSPSRSFSPARRSRSSSSNSSLSPERTAGSSARSMSDRSDLPPSDRSFSRFSERSESERSVASLSPPKWSTSPEIVAYRSPTPDDAISLSPPSSPVGFSAEESENVGPDISKKETKKSASNGGEVEKEKRRRRSTEEKDEPKPKAVRSKEASSRESKRVVKDRKEKSTDKKGKTGNNEKEGDREVKEKKQTTNKDKSKDKDVRSKAESVVVSKVKAGSERSHSSKRKKEKTKDSQKEKGTSPSRKRGGDEGKEKSSKTENKRPRKDTVKRNDDQKKELKMDEEERAERNVGLQISKDKDGTVREVLTSRARKRVKEDHGVQDISHQKRKVANDGDNDESKTRIVRVVATNNSKSAMVASSDQRRVVLSADTEEIEEEEQSEKKRSEKKKAKNKKHKKQKHKKGKHKKHKHKKSKSDTGDEASGNEKDRKKKKGLRSPADSDEDES